MYYLLSSSNKPRRWIGSKDFIKDLKWWSGAVITMAVPTPLQFQLKPYAPFSTDEDQYMGAFIYTNPPVWRDDFIHALRECGVNNFDIYDVEITNSSNKPMLDAFYQELRDGGIDDIDGYLKKIGVTNIDSFIDPNPDAVLKNYKAVNILGLVAAANMEKSIATVHDGIPLIDVDFDELVLDEQKAAGIKMFRLAESTNSILVHQSVRDQLIAKGFGSDLEFYDLKEAAL